jgi:hypothetical protein
MQNQKVAVTGDYDFGIGRCREFQVLVVFSSRQSVIWREGSTQTAASVINAITMVLSSTLIGELGAGQHAPYFRHYL